MRLINYSHPITPQQQIDLKNALFFDAQIETIPCQINMQESFMLQLAQLLPHIQPHESILVRLPGQPEAAALLLQLLIEKAALVTVVCFKPRKTAIGVEYIFKEVIVLTGKTDY